MEDSQVLFEMPVELELKKSADGGRRIIRGYASTENVDQDGEVILQKGIDFSPLLKSGFLNYDHQYKTINGAKMPIIIGYPTRAEIRDKGLWVEGELLKSDGMSISEQIKLADEMWEMGMALQKSGANRSLCYSVEGGVIERKGNRIVKSVVRHVAVTHKPVNPEATVELFAKSMFAACGQCDKKDRCTTPGTCQAAKAPISKEDVEDMAKAMSTVSAPQQMLENLDRGLTSVLYGPAQCEHYDRSTGKFKDGINGAVEHLEKCQGYTKEQGINFLRTLLHNAPNRPDVAALISTAGFTRNQ